MAATPPKSTKLSRHPQCLPCLRFMHLFHLEFILLDVFDWSSSLLIKASPRIPSIAILIWLSHILKKGSIEAQFESLRLRFSLGVRAPNVTSYELCCTERPHWTVTMTLRSRMDMTSLTALPKLQFAVHNTWRSPTAKTINSHPTYACWPQILGTHRPWFPSAAGRSDLKIQRKASKGDVDS